MVLLLCAQAAFALGLRDFRLRGQISRIINSLDSDAPQPESADSLMGTLSKN